MKDLCKFYNKREAIENSHVIPSYIYKWLKDTSPTGYLRATSEPNKREQDGSKSPLLCKECERDFSEHENFFKKEIFSKVANYRDPCPERLEVSESSKICIYIIAWRVLADAYYFPKANQYTQDEFDRPPGFLVDIKSLIKGNKSNKFRTHLIPCTREVLTKLNLPKVDWFYYERSVGAEPRIWDDLERFLIYIKIPFLIICFEMVPNDGDCWEGTQIDDVDSIPLNAINSCADYVPAQVEHFFEVFKRSRDRVSEKQIEKMKKDMEKANLDCGFFKSMNKMW
ncbi:hypothetical protein QO259_18540 [Salinicola sp. JS01]|uniref:hypothetical protein n=1 Tax=Salinicola sp. JS01 TaxID=3050071 RepID=UPI00255B6FBB|nr:hypothetical protein [Salinicola sp. JS01]WIX32776.1 hypothetical protein QO259_18540 [Salinicola sp. JS01]